MQGYVKKAVHLDFETKSPVDLRKTTVYKYASHPDTDVLCLCYTIQHNDIDDLVVPAIWRPGKAMPEALAKALSDPEYIVMGHNIAFERNILEHIMTPRYGFPKISPERYYCTMALSLSRGFPASLENALAAVGSELSKDMTGHRLMLQMSKPRKIICAELGLYEWWDEDKTSGRERLERLIRYCQTDVIGEITLKNRLGWLTNKEQKIFEVDQNINFRGIPLDIPAIRSLKALAELSSRDLEHDLFMASSGELRNPNAVAAIKTWLEHNGCVMKSLDKPAVSEALSDPETPPACKDVLEVRQTYAKSSVKKLNAMLESADTDGRVRGCFQYFGAFTGRWAGRKIQPQNMPRPELEFEEIEELISVATTDRPDADKIAWIKQKHGGVLNALSSCLRACIKAPEGYDFIGLDWSSIEARVLAWVADERFKTLAFHEGADVYLLSAEAIYGRPITKEDKDERQIGKVAELALGYQGGAGAFKSMATNYGIDVDENTAEGIKNAWRERHPMIVKFWHDAENAAFNALKAPVKDTQFRFGNHAAPTTFHCNGSFLVCMLPSRRPLYYPFPKFEQRMMPWGETRTVATYMTNTITGWKRIPLYGGLITENIVQAVARDILAAALVRIEQNPTYETVMHVHDEINVLVKKGKGSVEELEKIMTKVPKWASLSRQGYPDLPLAAEGWRGERYRK